MTLGLADVMDAVAAHAAATGWFDAVTNHEPKSAPGKGLSAAIWVEEVAPIPGRGGLDKTSVLVTFSVRLATSMTSEPQDDIDPNLLAAFDDLMRAYTGDFTLGALVAQIDLLGSYSQGGMRGKGGYLNQDGLLLRVFEITLPLVVDNLWDQAP
jgi:hypothetical protein